MTVRIKGVTVELNGTNYVIPPIALGALEQLQSRIGAFDGNVQDTKQISTVIDCAYAAMRRNYPDMTREEVADLIDIGNMNEVFAAVMDVSGLKRKEQEAHAQSINGLEAQYTVKVDVNGKVAGYGLATTPKNGTPESKFIVNADRFGVGSTGKADVFPFVVDTQKNRVGVNGELVVNGKAIIDKLNAGDIHGDKITANTLHANRLTAGSVTAREMAAGSITADKLAAGSITADKLAANSITSDKVSVRNLSSISSDLGDVRAGNINIGNGAFTVSSEGDLYAKNGRFEGTVYADKIEGDVLKFFQFQRDGVGRFSLRYHNNSSKNVVLSLQNLSFITPNSKSSYWVRIKINGQQIFEQEFWSVYSYTIQNVRNYDVYKGMFYNVPFLHIVNGNTAVDIVIEIDHEKTVDRITSWHQVDIPSIPYVLAARI